MTRCQTSLQQLQPVILSCQAKVSGPLMLASFSTILGCMGTMTLQDYIILLFVYTCLLSVHTAVLAVKHKVLHEETQLFRHAYMNHSVFHETLLKAQHLLDTKDYKRAFLGNEQNPAGNMGEFSIPMHIFVSDSLCVEQIVGGVHSYRPCISRSTLV